MSEPRSMRPELLEAIARTTLKRYDPRLVTDPETTCVPIEDIIESLGLSLEYQYIRKNRYLTMAISLYTTWNRNDTNLSIWREVKRSRPSVRQRSRLASMMMVPCAHELAHWLIHQELYSGSGNTAAMQKCTAKSSEADKYIERQADKLASDLLMPINQVKRCFYHTAGSSRIDSLAEQFGVSKQAMEIRLKEHSLI